MRVEPPVTQDPPERGRVLLRDGRAATVRPLVPDDMVDIERFFARLSAQSLANRFHAVVRPREAAALVPCLFEPDRCASLGIWSGVGDDRRLVAIGSYVRTGDRADAAAEIALTVADGLHGLGLGTLLLERLALVAAAAGLRRLVAEVRPGNEEMLDVLRESGFEHSQRRGPDGLRVDISIVPTRESVRRADERDREATVASLLPFFRPRSIAVVGASAHTDGIGRRLLDNLVDHGYAGPIWPVHPTATTIRGLGVYPSLAAVPGAPDLVVIAVPRPAVPAVVDDAGRVGARALLVITAGYGETGPEGRELQQALVEQVRGYGMRLIGPNCLGLVNTADDVRLDAIFAPADPPSGPVAMGSQSGALGIALLDYAREQDLGISSFVSVGNKADVSGNDLLQYWESDPATRLIVLYLESFGNPRRFARLARRVARTKPVLVVKAGRSAAGSRAAGSHTAALAASETAVDALFRQTGVIRADTLEELFDIASLLVRQPLPAGPHTAVVTNAGGPGILAVDALAAAGLELAVPGETTAQALRALLPREASIGNPVDMIASATAEQYAATARTLLADSAYDSLVVIFVPAGAADVADVYAAVEAESRAAAAAGRAKPVLFVSMQSGVQPRGALPVYRFPESAARALGTAWRHARWRREPAGELVDLPDIDPARGRAICQRALAAGRSWLAPGECLEVLDAFGIRSLPVAAAADADAAVRAADAIGYPVAVKMASSTLLHKSDWQGVRLGLGDADAVRAACEGIAASLAAAGHADALEGFTVQAMAPDGIELFAGSTTDPLFGPLLVFGLGGVDVEDQGDVVVRVSPLTDRDAAAMLSGIRGARRLAGSRGRPGADTAAVTELLLRLSRLVEEVAAVREVDLNPVVAGPPGQGYVVVDARIRVAAEDGG
jgi:acetyl coenzyme A synthetase (ADP forming)-like protein